MFKSADFAANLVERQVAANDPRLVAVSCDVAINEDIGNAIDSHDVAFRRTDEGGCAQIGIWTPDRGQHRVPDLGHFRKGFIALEQLWLVRKCCMSEDVVAAEKNERADV
ncbi:hypothetical protein N181_23485 [Sinorhizobium fredii USDA 205]|nr:hypothetical protein N181_23485 [Sinorhizobium fredii USDA 205]